MLWAGLIAGATGVVLGLWLRAPAAAVASAATVAMCAIATPLVQWSPLTAVLFGFALLTALQIGYLIGAMLACAKARAGSWSERC